MVLNNVGSSQTPAGAGNLTLANDANTTSSVTFSGIANCIRFDVPRCVSISNLANTSALNFTVYGWDIAGFPLVEKITGSTVANTTVVGKKSFFTICNIYCSAAANGTLTMGTSDKFGLPYVARDQNYISPKFDGYSDNASLRTTSGISVSIVANTGIAVANPNIKSNSLTFLTTSTIGGGTAGALYALPSAIIPGTSFFIQSSQALDVSTVYYEIVDPSPYAGTASLLAGTTTSSFTIVNSLVTPTSLIQISRNSTSAVYGNITIVCSAGSFTVTSDTQTDTGSFNWRIINNAYLVANPPVLVGQATLAAGTITITNPRIKASSTVLVSVATTVGTGFLTVPSGSVANGSIVITSTQLTDTSVVNYKVISPTYAGGIFAGEGTFTPADLTVTMNGVTPVLNSAAVAIGLTTGDVCGTYQPSAPTDGVKRLTINLFTRGSDIAADTIGQITSNIELVESSVNLYGQINYTDTTNIRTS
jgi:hypothetical protein